MEIRRIRKELQVLYGNVNSSDYRNAETAINDFLDFIEEERLTADILATLPENTVDIDEWIKNLWGTSVLSLPRDKGERMAFLLAVIKRFKDDVMGISHYFHASSNSMTSHVREYTEHMVLPVYQYLDGLLHRKELETEPVSTTSITAENVILVNGDNFGTISQNNNQAIRLLNELSSAIKDSEKLDKDAKLTAIANIDTVKSQMSLANPNKQIVKIAWNAVSAAATASGAIELAEKIAKAIGSLIS